MTPSVAVIIPAYNSAATIGRAVRSALVQPESSEVIVVDDASSDDTVGNALEAGHGAPRLRVLAQPLNLGPAAARNRGIRESNAPWIAPLDADDWFEAERLGRLLSHQQTSDFIADDIGRVSETNPAGPRVGLNWPPVAPFLTFADFVSSNVANTSRRQAELGYLKPIMRTTFLNNHGLHYREDLHLGEDYELYARALALGCRFRLMPEYQGYIAMTRADSITADHSPDDLRRFRDCDVELRSLPGLSRDDLRALRHHFLHIDCKLQWRLLIKAVNDRDPWACLARFARPWPVPLYLCSQLARRVAGELHV